MEPVVTCAETAVAAHGAHSMATAATPLWSQRLTSMSFLLRPNAVRTAILVIPIKIAKRLRTRTTLARLSLLNQAHVSAEETRLSTDFDDRRDAN
jgi:hypothetical protein